MTLNYLETYDVVFGFATLEPIPDIEYQAVGEYGMVLFRYR